MGKAAEERSRTGPLDEVDHDALPDDQPGAPRAPRGGGSIVILGVAAVILSAIVLYMATGAGQTGAGGGVVPPQGDPITVLDTARAEGRPAYILAHSAT